MKHFTRAQAFAGKTSSYAALSGISKPMESNFSTASGPVRTLGRHSTD